MQAGGAAGAAAAAAARAATTAAIKCWHCSKTGHYKSNCPELTGDGAEQRVQNLSIEECNEGHGLLTTQDEEECALAQESSVRRWANGRPQLSSGPFGNGGGVCGILSPDHLYIDTCATYTSTLYAHLLENLKKQLQGLCGHTNLGSSTMDEAGTLGENVAQRGRSGERNPSEDPGEDLAGVLSFRKGNKPWPICDLC